MHRILIFDISSVFYNKFPQFFNFVHEFTKLSRKG